MQLARTVTSASVPSAAMARVTPPAADRTPLGDAMGLLGDARITLAGTQIVRDYRGLLSLRSDLLDAARLLRQAASTGGNFPSEYRSGANEAARAARLIGGAYQLWRTVDGEPGGQAWARIESRMLSSLKRASVSLERAYVKAYTGTHP